jgi:hypothetical protein
MSGLSCSGCGAPLTLPTDLAALDAPCGYCTVRTPLPPDVVKLRLEEHAQLAENKRQEEVQARVGASVDKARSFTMWIVVLSVVAPLVLAGVITAMVSSATSNALRHLPVPSRPTRHR